MGVWAAPPRKARPAGSTPLGAGAREAAGEGGNATEGARALVDRGFAELEVQRVFAETMAVNTSSRRVLEKVGFRLVRTFHLAWDDPIEGTERGEVEYELCREDWESQ